MIFNDKYQQMKIINSGGFGMVFEVKEKNNDIHYALKIMEKNFYEEYQKEIDVLKKINNKYIIKLKDNFYDKTNNIYCIVMELCDGDLRMILNKYKPKGLPLNMINKIFTQLNDALKAMIKINYTHRDLKPENILIKYTDNNKNNFDIKLTDFGIASNKINSSIKSHTKAGTNNYMAPEIEDFKYNNKCDLWSLGVILYELYTNNYIFDSNNSLERVINRYNGIIRKETDNENINKLIRKLIQVDINKRIKWEEYFNDNFFKNNNIKSVEKIFNFEEIIQLLNSVSRPCNKLNFIINGNILTLNMFDSRGNKNPNDYEKNGKRGNFNYFSPIGWTGYGLRVKGKYDNGDDTWLGKTGNKTGEWCVAYHGTQLSFAKSIIINGLKVGPTQSLCYDDDLNHPGNKVGKGVYLCRDFKYAKEYSNPVQGYRCIFMCRVNPKVIRICRRYPQYCVVDGNINCIRPYRLLIKKEDEH